MEEEAAADYVNAPARTGKKMAARPGQRSRCFSQSFLPIAVCWLILLVIMGLRIYFTNRNLNNSVSEKPITNLTALKQDLETRNQELETRNQELETERKNLTGPIQNISRAQWSIDEYCPKVQNVSYRRCRPCQEGWRLIRSSCYLFADPSDLKTWEEAREDCRARSSDLLVVHEDEQDAFGFYSRYGPWIGLKSEGGRWKWIDGRDLTESVSRWIQEPHPPTDGQCVFSDRFKWISESCAERRPWICQKKSLSV
ncbi:NKG2-D type II integral membrane protein-like [Etheostoma spectabile]|uniref:NKG2-D type II integral membrane protein-like n=1 Tax=Etheostoma spectabile TaxID=54343 RepID=UPI0013AF73E0|nr:NKG2-D type II integral membrane protein-like [Etheostoma spectabile]